MRVNEPITNREIEISDREVLVSRTDAAGRIVFANKAFTEISGFTEQELLGAPHNLVRHPHMPKEAFADLWQTIKAGRPWEGLVKNRAKNGDYYWVRANVTPVIEDGSAKGFISIRTRPSRGQVEAAERAYTAIRNGKKGLRIEEGASVRPGPSQRLRRLAAGVSGRLTAMVALSALTVVTTLVLCNEVGTAAAAGLGVIGTTAVGAVAWSLAAMLRRLTGRIEQHFEAIARNETDHEIEMPASPEFHRVISLLRATKAKLAYADHERRELERKAEEMRRHTLDEMAQTIESEARGAIELVIGVANTMASGATEMADSAQRVSGHAQGVAAASEEALVNAQAVSAATEQLAASIGEITQQISHSSAVARSAVECARRSETAIGTLSTEVAGIGAMADLIGSIARQTNLLALNATIEAARAGDAGRGFAVVATEVKSLADQTAHSTEEINRRLAAIAAATETAVGAVSGIGKTVEEIDAAAAAIAAAMEEQSAATREISRNVSETTTAAREVSALIAQVSHDASRTGEQAGEIQDKSHQVSESIGGLPTTLTRLVRTSTKEADRRMTQRYDVDLPCRVRVGGNERNARVLNLSTGGAMITGSGAEGERGTLSIRGCGTDLPFTVKLVGDDSLHVEFEFTDATLRDFRSSFSALVGAETTKAA